MHGRRTSGQPMEPLRPGDTLTVQCFTFEDPSPQGWGAPYRGTFHFPHPVRTWSKILMVKTLRCDSATAADRFPCGEWDYHTHTSLILERDSVEELMELAAFITPYGIRLDLTDDGWEWVTDVSDYAPLLTGTRKLIAGNNQELLDLKFLFIAGTPPREVISVENLWETKLYRYDALALDSVLTARKLLLNPDAAGFKLKARISGHGHEGPFNCCEWDPKTHGYVINGDEKYRWIVWTDCGFNALYPQGGTWPFDRAGWCPGTFVDEHSVELTGRYFPGDSITIDYDIEMFRDNGEGKGEFRMAHQLITYGPRRFRYDAEITEIISPNALDRYRRVNPSCSQGRIVIRNNGAMPLTEATIIWSEGKKRSRGHFVPWQGLLLPGQSDTVTFPVRLRGAPGESFSAYIFLPKGCADEVPHNNIMCSTTPAIDTWPANIALRFETNDQNRARENAWTLTGNQGIRIAQSTAMADDSVYVTPLNLKPGCYTLTITDDREEGIMRHWWLRGSAPDRIGKNGKIAILGPAGEELKTFPADFGEKIIYTFRVR
jgi:hypothetical protein